jgi:thioredoxin-like negative regulator of GroEL
MIVLYSKYSPKCKDILQLLSQHSVDYMHPLCVDNIDVRKRILNDKQYNISSVPSILLVYPNNTIEKFEGPNVSQWLQHQLAPPEPIKVQETPPPVDTNTTTLISDLIGEDDQPIEVREMDLDVAGMSQAIVSSETKSVAEIAAEMAKSREDADIPVHQRKRELAAESKIPA